MKPSLRNSCKVCCYRGLEETRAVLFLGQWKFCNENVLDLMTGCVESTWLSCVLSILRFMDVNDILAIRQICYRGTYKLESNLLEYALKCNFIKCANYILHRLLYEDYKFNYSLFAAACNWRCDTVLHLIIRYQVFAKWELFSFPVQQKMITQLQILMTLFNNFANRQNDTLLTLACQLCDKKVICFLINSCPVLLDRIYRYYVTVNDLEMQNYLRLKFMYLSPLFFDGFL